MVIRIGQKAPDFSLPDSNGGQRSLGEFIKAGPLVIAFFPFAFSGTCDKEMCTFRDGFGSLQSSGVRLVGISVDSAFSLRAFSQTYNLQFPLLSDFNKKVVRQYGVLQDPWGSIGYRGVAKRAVFVLDGRGMLRYRWVTDNPGEEPPYGEVVKSVQKLVQ